MRMRLNDENYIAKPSHNTTQSADLDKSAQTPKRTAAAIAAEVADKLTASSSSQMIMHSVLSTFAAEEAKNAGLVKASTTNSFSSMPVNPIADSVSKTENSVSVADPNMFFPPSNHSYQTLMVPQTTMQNQAPASQAQYQMLPNPQSQQYMQASGTMMPPFGFGSIRPLPAGLPPPPHMVSPMVPLQITQPQQPIQMTQQQQIPMGQQPTPLPQQLPMLPQHPPAPPSFRPLQPPGMVYYSHPPHS